jgi:hypothetical protein
MRNEHPAPATVLLVSGSTITLEIWKNTWELNIIKNQLDSSWTGIPPCSLQNRFPTRLCGCERTGILSVVDYRLRRMYIQGGGEEARLSSQIETTIKFTISEGNKERQRQTLSNRFACQMQKGQNTVKVDQWTKWRVNGPGSLSLIMTIS